MGVKDLWNILSPVCNQIPINGLKDKTVAIDLSCWVCEGQFVGDKSGSTQPRMNLFFRTHALLMMNTTPIFILDGEAPELKQDAMKQRTNHRFRRFRKFRDNDDPENPKKAGRSRFKGILFKCRDMLELMGVTCLESDGEAEALCGQLSRDGLVDGVITQDSDVFLYGAKVVYRNFAMKNGTGTVDSYDMKNIEKELKLTREKLIAMSLFCGCDYDLAGVQGVGKEIAFKYLSSLNGDVLDRLKNLRTNQALIKLEEEKNGCQRCCHPGKASEHKKDGCVACFRTKSCEENFSKSAYKNLTEEEKKSVNLELNLRRKAIADPGFPNQETIDEYLNTNQILADFDASWKKPNICKLINICSRMMEWEVEYGFGKIFPMVARWMLNRGKLSETDEIFPEAIVKKRVLRGVACYELAWRIRDENLSAFLALMLDDPPETFSSCETQTVISEILPKLHEEFSEKKVKRKCVSKKKKNLVLEARQCPDVSDSDSTILIPSKKMKPEVLIPQQSPPSPLPTFSPPLDLYTHIYPEDYSPPSDNESFSAEDYSPPTDINPPPQVTDVEVIEISDSEAEPENIKTNQDNNFSLGLDNFCNMTIDHADEETDSESDISILVNAIMSRKPF